MRTWICRHPAGSVAAGIFAVGVVMFVLVWFQPQKLFLDKTVNESLPGVIQTNPPAAAPGNGVDTGSRPTPPSPTAQPPAPALKILASGGFRSLEHGTAGTARVLQQDDGALILRLESLDTSNGPDLRVYLSEVSAGHDLHAYGERFVDLGALKGNRGNQNYSIPAGLDLSRFKSAVIWCRRFQVGFGVAALRP